MSTTSLVARRLATVTVVAAVISLLAYGIGYAVRGDAMPWESDQPSNAAAPANPQDQGDVERQGTSESSHGAQPRAEAEGADAPSTGSEAAKKPGEKSPEPSGKKSKKAKKSGPPAAGPALYSPGDRGAEVREIQARLKQIAWFSGDVTDFYGDVTTEAIRGFQAKRGFSVTGAVDQRTLDRLHEMTREPTQDELTNQPPPNAGGNTPGALDARCQTGQVLCIDKSSRTLRWVVDGKVRKTVDVRFGSEMTPTREGQFSIDRKSRDHVSSLFHTAMPFAMFFSGGQAVHYSSDFAARGYNGASHGCVNVRDRAGVEWIFDQARVGDKVVVYWS
ncbi:MAG: L,D-transpeptidase family protein [Nocardioidaceae bacterium]|nr:L,D-transpeptidase family protein [Nocardioidaceae bacterium]